jgi:hypothetical protein
VAKSDGFDLSELEMGPSRLFGLQDPKITNLYWAQDHLPAVLYVHSPKADAIHDISQGVVKALLLTDALVLTARQPKAGTRRRNMKKNTKFVRMEAIP